MRSGGAFRFENLRPGEHLIQVLEGEPRETRLLLTQTVDLEASVEDARLAPAPTAPLVLEVTSTSEYDCRFEAFVRARLYPEAVELPFNYDEGEFHRLSAELPMDSYQVRVEESCALRAWPPTWMREDQPWARIPVELGTEGKVLSLFHGHERSGVRLLVDPVDCPIREGKIFVEGANGVRGPEHTIAVSEAEGAMELRVQVLGEDRTQDLRDPIDLVGPLGPGRERLVVELAGFEPIDEVLELDGHVVPLRPVRQTGQVVWSDLPTRDEHYDTSWSVQARRLDKGGPWQRVLWNHFSKLLIEEENRHQGYLEPGTYEFLVRSRNHPPARFSPVVIGDASSSRRLRHLPFRDALKPGFHADVRVHSEKYVSSSLFLHQSEPSGVLSLLGTKTTSIFGTSMRVRFRGLERGHYSLSLDSAGSRRVGAFEILDSNVELTVRIDEEAR